MKTERRNHQVISASAGTGKTFSLVQIISEKVLGKEEIPLDQIILLTFTEAATAELRERLRSNLLNKISNGNKRQKELAHRALQVFDRAYIHTIHGFCNRINSEFNIGNAGVESSVLKDSDEIIAIATQRVVRNLQNGDHINDSSQTYHFAGLAFTDFCSLDSKTLMKTVNATVKYFNQQNRQIPLSNLLTDKGKEIEDLISPLPGIISQLKKLRKSIDPAFKGLLPPEGLEHSWVLHLLKTGLQSSKIEAAESLSNSKNLINPILSNSVNEPPSQVAQLWSDYSRIVHDIKTNYIMDKKEILSFLISYEVSCEVWKMQDQIEQELNVFTYRSMILNLRDEVASRSELRNQLQNKFKLALIDEFQDTDQLQWEVFHNLFLTNETQADRSLIIVGDEKQSLYSFRGADSAIFQNAISEIYSTSGKPTTLKVNFRSSENILRSFNTVFDVLLDSSPLYEPGSWHKEFPSEENVRNQSQAPLSDEVNENIQRHREAMSGSAGWDRELKNMQRSCFNLLDFSDTTFQNAEEIVHSVWTACANEVKTLLSRKNSLKVYDKDKKSYRDLEPADIAVLVRTGSEANDVSEIFRDHQLETENVSRNNIWHSDECIQIKWVLKAIFDSERTANLILAGFGRISAITPARLSNQNFQEDFEKLYEKLLPLKNLGHQMHWGLFFRKLEEMFKEGVFSIPMDPLNFSPPNQVASNLEELLRQLQKFALENNANPDTLMRYLERTMQEKEDSDIQTEPKISEESNKIKIMTMHQSKGLEFPVVFVGGTKSGKNRYPEIVQYLKKENSRINKKVFLKMAGSDIDQHPDWQSGDDEDRLRLYYVAITRAEYMVYLPFIPNVKKDGLKKVNLWPISQIILPKLDQLTDESISIVKPNSVLPMPDSDDLRAACSISEPQNPELPAIPFPSLQELDQRRNVVQSFSSLHRRSSHSMEQPDPEDEIKLDETNDTIDTEEHTIQLTGGVRTGSYLHKLLEDFPFKDAQNWSNPADAASALKDKIENTAKYYKVLVKDSATGAILSKTDLIIEETSRILYHSLHSPFLPNGGRLCDLDDHKVIKEMNFLADDSGYRKQIQALNWGNSKGFITGSIDLFFEWEDKYYLLDYKSNQLAAYSKSFVSKSVLENYHQQLEIYELAICDYLGDKKERYGGFYFTYLRGMNILQPDLGVFFSGEHPNGK